MEQQQQQPTVFSVNDFIFYSKLENINLYKLKKHIIETNLVQKIGGFAQSLQQKDDNVNDTMKINIRNNTGSSNNYNNISSGSTSSSSKGNNSEVLTALRCIVQLLSCLTNIDKDGRVFLINMHNTTNSSTTATNTTTNTTINDNNTKNTTLTIPTIKFILLNPSVPFAPIVNTARSVLLLGGTMRPFDYFTTLLLPTIIKSKLFLFCCNHVIPVTQVSALIVPTVVLPMTNNMIQLEFTYEKRLRMDMTNALFHALMEICLNTPGGVVVFFTSFSYLEILLQRWRSSKLFYKLDAIKRIFTESRAYSTGTTANTTTGTEADETTENVWNNYQRQIQNNPVEGAVLFSVINGKLSEGINFSDELARCVVVVGLPYPDVRDPVLQEKMRYVGFRECETAQCSGVNTSEANSLVKAISTTASTTTCSTTTTTPTSATTPTTSSRTITTAAGRRLCESMCMKSVNQSIGRAIRHINDYACVVLLDRRYQQEHLRAQLPQWLLRNISVVTSCSSSGSSNTSTDNNSSGSSSGGLGTQLKAFFASQQFK